MWRANLLLVLLLDPLLLGLHLFLVLPLTFLDFLFERTLIENRKKEDESKRKKKRGGRGRRGGGKEK